MLLQGGKHGTFVGKDEIAQTYEDSESGLELFGANSIVGRSIVIHYADGNRWVCADIQPTWETISLEASNFNGPAQGCMVFTQATVDPSSDASILIRLASIDSAVANSGHNWHVSVNFRKAFSK